MKPTITSGDLVRIINEHTGSCALFNSPGGQLKFAVGHGSLALVVSVHIHMSSNTTSLLLLTTNGLGWRSVGGCRVIG